MSFPRYPKYKDSGVEWLGEVPEHWDIAPAKWHLRPACGGNSIKGTCANEPGIGLYPGFSASGQDVWLENYDFNVPGIVLSAVGARCGKTFKADGAWGVVANTHCLFPIQDSGRDYFWYLTNQEDWWEKGGSAQPFVKVSETLARKWVFPPLVEQTRIAEFLDRETAKIDELVAEQRWLMELLTQKRQAVISHAVTKGLNPNAPMKPSGIEWVCDIPEHWKPIRLRFACSTIFLGLTTKVDYVENGGVPLVRALNILGGVLDLSDVRFISDEQHKSLTKRNRAKRGDVLLSKSGSIGTVALVDNDTEFSIYESIFVLRPREGILTPKYLLHLLRSPSCSAQYSASLVGMGVGHLNMSDIVDVRVALPPLREQSLIVEHLESEIGKFDILTAEAQRAIDLLQVRRTAVISAAVTGQIDVRKHANRKETA